MQDGQNKRRIMLIDGTGAGALIIRSVKFHRGYAFVGGGIYSDLAADLVLELCAFSQCQSR